MTEFDVILEMAETDREGAAKRAVLGFMRGDATQGKLGYTAANAIMAAAEMLGMPDEDVARATAPKIADHDFIAFLHHLHEQGASTEDVIYAVEKPWKWSGEYADYLISWEDGAMPAPTPIGRHDRTRKAAMLTRTNDEIDEQVGRAIDHPRIYPGMSYADGVQAALDWVIGAADSPPIPDEDVGEGS